MKRPPDHVQYDHGLESCYVDIRKGSFVLSDFYDQGYWHSNNIPRELEEKNWKPNPDTMYKYWWYHTNPSDPSDSGEDVLVYIEEWNIWIDKPKLRQDIIEKLYNMDSNSLLRLQKYIDKL